MRTKTKTKATKTKTRHSNHFYEMQKRLIFGAHKMDECRRSVILLSLLKMIVFLCSVEPDAGELLSDIYRAVCDAWKRREGESRNLFKIPSRLYGDFTFTDSNALADFHGDMIAATEGREPRAKSVWDVEEAEFANRTLRELGADEFLNLDAEHHSPLPPDDSDILDADLIG
jgi:hypothetical protein